MGKSLMSFITPRNIKSVEKFRDRIKESPTMMGLIEKLDGTSAKEALNVIENLSTKEKRVLATLIGEINAEIRK